MVQTFYSKIFQFDVNRPAIVKHIGNIYKSQELDKKTTCSKMEQVAKDNHKTYYKYGSR
jgi:hypothetical protein